MAPADETPPAASDTAAAATNAKQLHSAHSSSGMQASVLRFKDVSFTVGSGEKTKTILSDINGKVKWGQVLALMGPSGAGKTVLISTLTLDALFGRASGSVTLNGVPLTDEIFKQHAYVVVQHDKLWPYLTCRETMRYAAELYAVERASLDAVVDSVINKLGLRICADTRNARLSGGQQRRLSLALALLKNPTLLFLDEPTSGLDAAAAEKIMQEIVSVARSENLIVMCTIHQPSTKVYNGFDQVMILSKGREAFTGDVKDAAPYFDSIGYPLPVQTNPAEHFLDLVNADFSDDAEVDKILDTWQEMRPDKGQSSHHKQAEVVVDDEGQTGVTKLKRASFGAEMMIMFRRQALIITRDPILYLGRSVIFLVSNLIFGLVYLNARPFDQDQAQNKVWVQIWFIAVPSNMGVVAVYALNDEFKSVVREVKNGMVSPLTYVVAKSLLVLPIMVIFALFALVLPAYVIMDFPWDTFGLAVAIWSACIFAHECLAECLSVWFDDPIIGMLQFMNYWFGAFLFGGFLIPLSDMFWPFELFYYIMPYSYFLRATIYNALEATEFSPCDTTQDIVPAICFPDDPTSGRQILVGLNRVLAVIEDDDTVMQDIGILLLMAAFFKVCYIAGVIYKSTQVSKIHGH